MKSSNSLARLGALSVFVAVKLSDRALVHAPVSESVAVSIARKLFSGSAVLPSRASPSICNVALFATIHGDEPEGAVAMARLLERLARQPALASGYALFFYPLCNPTGFQDDTRTARTGLDLNREFWRDSASPEVQLLETELRQGQFHGIIQLHADDTSGHRMHAEHAVLSAETAAALNAVRTEGGRIVAVGSTALRTTPPTRTRNTRPECASLRTPWTGPL